MDDKDIPTMVRIPIAPSVITLRDLKAYLSLRNSSNYKFYFKARDKDCGIVKEEIFHDNTPLPFFQDKVVAYIESIEGANSPIGGGGGGEGGMALSSTNGSRSKHDDALPKTRHGLVSDSTFSTDHGGDSTTETDSMISSRRGGQYLSSRHRNYCKGSSNHHSRYGKCGNRRNHHGHHKGHHHHHHYRNRNNMSRTSSASSFSEMSYDVITVKLNLDVVNYLGISLVGQTSQKGDGGIYVSSIMKGGAVDIDGRIHPGDMILQVNETNFSNLTNDEAVNVIREAVKKPGPIKLLVAKTWDPNPKGHFTIPRSEPVRPIDPGAWVAHTEAARAKYTSHETNLPLTESTLASYNASAIVSSVLPPSAEMAAAAVASGSDRFLMTAQLQHHLHHHQSSLTPFSSVIGPSVPGNAYAASSATSTSMTYPATALPSAQVAGGDGDGGGSPLRGGSFKAAGLVGSVQSAGGQHSVTISNAVTTVAPAVPLSTESSLETIAAAMASPDSGLDIRDRMWLKIRIPSAFIGSDVVSWLYSYVAGFSERKDAKKVASRLLKEGFIRHTINLKNSFSEKCYYVFSEAVLHKVVQHSTAGHQLESSGVSRGGGGGGGATKPNSIYPSMPFMRYWDETSEIQNYGLIGPNSDEGVGILDSLHHSSGLNGTTNHHLQHHPQHHLHDPYQSDEQMSQRSGQSVLFNPAAAVGGSAHLAGGALHTVNSNTMGSSGSAGSRLTNSSASNNNSNNQHQSSSTTTVVSNGNGSSTANSANGSGVNGGGGGNLLNHHYEDLQMNHATGNLVPVGSLPLPLCSSSEANEYSGHNYHNQQQHIFAQPSMFRHHHHQPQQLNQEEMLVAMMNGGGGAEVDQLQHHHSPQSEDLTNSEQTSLPSTSTTTSTAKSTSSNSSSSITSGVNHHVFLCDEVTSSLISPK
ncbi:Segment polarity protein dishevelled DVL-3 [Tyrophagus putrescentiae]|nr:Segment polarity protein dishevelled DVL-3 [Tyrophagus putrescentiae]